MAAESWVLDFDDDAGFNGEGSPRKHDDGARHGVWGVRKRPGGVGVNAALHVGLG